MFGSLLGSSYWILMGVALTAVTATENASYRTDPYRIPERNLCIDKETCHECIQTPRCAWCSEPSYMGPRCFLPGRIIPGILTTCSEEFIQNPDNSLTILRLAKLTNSDTSFDNSNEGNSISSSSSTSSTSSYTDNMRQGMVQFSPQELKLDLRIREPHNISFSYAETNDFPVDIYYLTNFRQPIENGKNHMIELGELLVESLRNVTSNFRLGFGSTISYSPTAGTEQTYGFKNIMSLSEATTTFVDSVRSHIISDNSTALNGGLDAILQAIVCREEIGWRPVSQKILVFSTDTEFPQNINTSDEVLQQQNDGLCHFSGREFSTYPSSQGHPTISQINQIVKQNKVHIIWAVTDEHHSTFRTLANSVEGSTTRKLSDSSITIPDLIQQSYQYISSSVEIKDTATDNVKVRYFSSCLKDGAINETAKCNGLKVGDNVQFFAQIEATECSRNKSEWHRNFSIYPIGINQSLTIDLYTICDCHCEHPSNHLYETQSPMCHGAGTLKCGICECNDGRFGRYCECGSLPPIRDHPCRPDNTSLVDCSGRGVCVCGNCQCNMRANRYEIITGQFCECDNFSCDRHNGLLCSNNGFCSCGVCECHKGWVGPACNCATSTMGCIGQSDIDSGVSCSGHGQCVCGECVCNMDAGGNRYIGKFCDRGGFTDSEE